MRFLKIILFYLKWVFYCMLTIEERNKFITGKINGMNCTNIEHGLFSSTVTYNRFEKPKKDYITFKEFKDLHYPK